MVWCDHCVKNVLPLTFDSKTCCTECGRILSEDNFSTDVDFVKNAAGQSQAMGVNVKTVQTDYSASRERTLENARDNMRHLARSVMMDDGDMVVMPATRLYTIALERNFTRGRRRELVEAACIYIALRETNKPYLLIDFSDYLRINVYELGGTFLQLCKLLSLQDHSMVQKPVDPSLFIHRYAERLVGEGNGYQAISKTAMRIIASMKRDWMQTGRKPSGLCGAALYISALSHGQKCSKSDVVKVVHICEATLTKRLVEFESTESGSLTIEEFEAKAKELETEYISAKERNFFGKYGSEKLLCSHRNEKVRKHGLCNNCYDKVITFYGGLDGGSEPPAFQRAESARMIENCEEDNTDSLEPNEQMEHGISNTHGNEKSQFIEPGTTSNCGLAGDKNTFVKEDGVTSSPAHDESEGLSDIDDIEMDGYLHTEEEKHFKKIIWEEMNKGFDEEQAAKEADAAAAKKKEKKPKRSADAKNAAPAQTASEATCRELTKKRLGSKINYQVLQELFDESEASQNHKKSRSELEISPNKTKDDSYEYAEDEQAYDEDMHYENAEEGYGYLGDGYCDEGFF